LSVAKAYGQSSDVSNIRWEVPNNKSIVYIPGLIQASTLGRLQASTSPGAPENPKATKTH